MNGTLAALSGLGDLAAGQAGTACDIVICPPAHLLIPAVTATEGGSVEIGAQDCHSADKGAHTGDIAASMLREVGVHYVIVGHSERRAAYGENDADVRAKAAAAQSAGLCAIVCIGESLDQREAGTALDVIRTQLAGSVPDGSTGKTLVVAYEPIWAIGTGKIPSLSEIAEVHADMRAQLTARFGADVAQSIRLLYGGSVKPDNAASIFGTADVDGALVGGASLKASDFSPIISALSAA